LRLRLRLSSIVSLPRASPAEISAEFVMPLEHETNFPFSLVISPQLEKRMSKEKELGHSVLEDAI